jgi:hypothetical protein
MTMTANMKWQDWATFLLGVWLAVSPWVLGFGEQTAAMWNALILGVVLVVFSLLELGFPEKWEEWVNMLAGVWLVIAPFALGFTSHFVASVDTMLIGAAATLLSAWALSLDKDIGKWWHEHVTG